MLSSLYIFRRKSHMVLKCCSSMQQLLRLSHWWHQYKIKTLNNVLSQCAWNGWARKTLHFSDTIPDWNKLITHSVKHCFSHPHACVSAVWYMLLTTRSDESLPPWCPPVLKLKLLFLQSFLLSLSPSSANLTSTRAITTTKKRYIITGNLVQGRPKYLCFKSAEFEQVGWCFLLLLLLHPGGIDQLRRMNGSEVLWQYQGQLPCNLKWVELKDGK